MADGLPCPWGAGGAGRGQDLVVVGRGVGAPVSRIEFWRRGMLTKNSELLRVCFYGRKITLLWISWNLPEAAFNSLMGFNGFNGCEGRRRRTCQNNQEEDGLEDNSGMPAVNSSGAPTRSKSPDQSRTSLTANLLLILDKIGCCC